MLRWLYALVAGGILSGFAALLLTGRYINDGPVVIELTGSRGLHAGDLFVMAGWAVGMVVLALLARIPARAAHTEPPAARAAIRHSTVGASHSA